MLEQEFAYFLFFKSVPPVLKLDRRAVVNCDRGKRKMSVLRRIFAKRPAVIGMVHVLPLPGTPRNWATIDQIAERACADAKTYVEEGVDAVLVENMHDIPFVRSVHES